MAFTVQFVDSIASSPTVRLDLNDGSAAGVAGITTNKDDADLSPPNLTRAVADTILTDGALISGSAYDNRVVKLRLYIQGSSQDNLATRYRLLMTELNRPQNILKWQPGSTPLFFRTFRSPDVTVDSSQQAKNRLFVTCQILAEPFAYGLRVDVAGVSVKADPALTNGCYLDVNGVTGDVETPAYVALSAGTRGSATSPTVLAVRRHGTPSSLQFVYQAEATAVGADTTVTGSHDATASGAGNNTLTTTFSGSSALATRLTATLSGTEIAGTYRVYARVKKSAAGNTMTAGLAINGPTGYQFQSAAVTIADNTSWQFLDLGQLQLPPGQFSPTGYSGVDPTIASTDLQVQASVSPVHAANLLWDYILLIPADEGWTAIAAGGWAWASTTSLVLDGPNDTCYYLSSGSVTSGLSGRDGSIPQLRPGSNRLYFVENMGAAGVTDSTTVTVSYWPRWLFV